MTSKAIYYCVYRITNLVEKKHYYGYKSSKIHPSKVIGVTYFSSSKGASGKEFIEDQKNTPQNYKYKIVQIFETSEEAINREIRLHNKFDVKKHPKFINKANQTTNKFDTTGTVMSIESRKKMSLARRGKPKTEKHRLAMSGRKHTEEEISKISKALKGLVKSEEHRKKLSEASKISSKGEKNSRFKQYYHTPWGIFELMDLHCNSISSSALFRWCTKSDKLIDKSCYASSIWLRQNFLREDILGKSFRSLGFYTISKEEYKK